jgi:hypothetical protein
MSHQVLRLFRNATRGLATLLVGLGLQLVFQLGSSLPAVAQVNEIQAACPTACGIRVDIKSVKLRERSDGIDAIVDWDFSQTAPEIKIKNFNVTAIVEFNRLGKDERTVSVSPDQRQAVIPLQSGGFNKDIKFSDVTSVRASVAAIAEPLPAINVTDLPSIKIVGQGGDSAVEVSWRPPTPMACSAERFSVSVKAINEKGDRLDGVGTAASTARSLRVQFERRSQ